MSNSIRTTEKTSKVIASKKAVTKAELVAQIQKQDAFLASRLERAASYNAERAMVSAASTSDEQRDSQLANVDRAIAETLDHSDIMRETALSNSGQSANLTARQAAHYWGSYYNTVREDAEALEQLNFELIEWLESLSNQDMAERWLPQLNRKVNICGSVYGVVLKVKKINKKRGDDTAQYLLSPVKVKSIEWVSTVIESTEAEAEAPAEAGDNRAGVVRKAGSGLEQKELDDIRHLLSYANADQLAELATLIARRNESIGDVA